MPTSSALIAFAAFSVAVVVVPGPSVLFIIGRGVALGRRAALLTVVGNTGGAMVMVLVVAVGLGPLLDRSDRLFDTLRWAGAAYLIWLGLTAIRDRATAAEPDPTAMSSDAGRHLRDGFVVGATNPKLAVFLAAVLPQFVEGDRSTIAQIAVLGAVFAIVALVCDGAWGVAAGSARHWIGRSPRRLERLTVAGGVIMIAVGLTVAIH